HPCLADRGGEPGAVPAEDDPVTSPGLEPAWRYGLKGPLLHEDRPGTVRTQIVRDPLEDAPTCDARRLDQERDVWRPDHGIRSPDSLRRRRTPLVPTPVKDLIGGRPRPEPDRSKNRRPTCPTTRDYRTSTRGI